MHLHNPTLFLLLIIGQALHSVEEYVFRLWEVFAPARYISGLFSASLPVGFGIVNLAIVAFGVWCYLGPVLHHWRSASGIMWFWALLELANGIGHTLFALGVSGYFPGLFTVPVLLVGSAVLLLRLLKDGPGSPGYPRGRS